MSQFISGDVGSIPQDGVIIVLAGEQHRSGAIGAISRRRCEKAAELFLGGGFSKILASGGASNNFDPPVAPLAAVMAELLVSAGVPKDAILVDTVSFSTRTSVVNSARLLKGIPGPVMLVTSDYHCLRAKRSFLRAGIAVSEAPVAEQQGADSLIREACKVAYYWARGWL